MKTDKAEVATDRTAEFRGLLGAARQRLLRTVTVTDDELASLAAHEPGALIEDSSREVMEELLGRLEGRERHELDEIHVAQARLETGSFGACESCRGAIPLSRLRAVPWARHCLDCQAKQERP